MQNVGGFNSRGYGNVSPNLGVSRGQINDLYLPQQYLHLEDEFGDLPGRLERRLPTSFARHEEDTNVRKYIYTGVAAVSLITENLLSHPFVVLRRQCQVHNASGSYHLIPITLIPVIYNLQQRQGLTSLWKGLGSALLVRGLTLGVEDLISKITPWPKEISWHSSAKQFLQHTLLKCVSLAVITPFYSASLVETVQSDIASEKPGILDVFKEGFMRILNWGGGPKGRMLPIWALVLPTVTLGICRYFFSTIVKSSSFHIIHYTHQQEQESKGALPKDPGNALMLREIELTSSLIAIISSDIVFYPFETILHRLHLQGTRTIIDNLDTGTSVLAILTNYEGPLDCYESCLTNEGPLGFYKGFGALILQYAAHICVVYVTRLLLTELTMRLRSSAPKPKPPLHNSPPVIQNLAGPGDAYLLP